MRVEHVSVYVTAPDMEAAKRIARSLLDRQLVACANILPVQSMYRWKGQIEEGPEVAMFMKTRRALVPEVERAVREIHPYEVPCIVAFDLVAGSARYLSYVDEETRSGTAPW